jgi:hypothetical protein
MLGPSVQGLLAAALLFAPPKQAEGPAPPPEPRGPPPAAPAPGLDFDPGSAPTVDTTPSDLGLIRQQGGGYLYVDPAKRFTAEFAPDGTVHFADRWKRPSGDHPQRGTCCALPAEGFAALNPLAGMQMKGPIEWLFDLQGADPNAIAKNAILDQTRELRIRLAIAYNLDLLDRRLRELAPELLQVWSDESMSDARKRELIFERWDDCDERFSVQPGDVPDEAVSEIDRVRVETAERARRKIEAFIRRHAPAGTRRGYTKQELRQFNRRRVSQEEFSPYRRGKR